MEKVLMLLVGIFTTAQVLAFPKVVICDNCTEQQRLFQAAAVLDGAGSVIVADREEGRFSRYQGVLQDASGSLALQVEPAAISADEKRRLQAGLRYYRALGQLGTVHVADLALPAAAGGMGASVLEIIGIPTAIGTLANRVSEHATAQARAAAGSALDGLGAQLVAGANASVTVRFEDGSTLVLELDRLRLPAMRVSYRAVPQTAQLANGEHVPWRRAEARWLQVEGNQPLLNRYAAALKRLGLPVKREAQTPAACTPTGIRCDDRACRLKQVCS